MKGILEVDEIYFNTMMDLMEERRRLDLLQFTVLGGDVEKE